MTEHPTPPRNPNAHFLAPPIPAHLPTAPAAASTPPPPPPPIAPDEIAPTIPAARPSRRARAASSPVMPTEAARAGQSTTIAAVPSAFARYRIGETLGRGGMGLVRVALDPALRREIAIKTLLGPGQNSAAIAQFIDEAQITGQLEHPNIVPVHELGLDEQGRPWLAMKRVVGHTLRERLGDTARMPRGPLTAAMLGDILDIVKKIGDALAFAHAKGVVHRDLKPDNIMLGRFGEVLVMDWGLAKATSDSNAPAVAAKKAAPPGRADAPPSAVSGRLAPVSTERRDTGFRTVDGTIFGTPAYMPPEQARGDIDDIGPRSDIFSLGGILYHMLTLHAPYEAPSAILQIGQAATHDLLPPAKRAPERRIPRELAAIVMTAMAKHPRERYATVPAFLADLAAFDRHSRTTAYRPSPIETLAKWVRRHPTMAMAGATSAIFAAVLGVVVMAWQSQAAQAAQAQILAAERATQAERVSAAEAARRAEAEARQRDAERVANDRQAMLDAMQAGDYAFVLRQLSGQVQHARDDALTAFDREYRAAHRHGRTVEQFVREMDQSAIDACIAAFEALFEAHRQWGVEVSANDFFHCGAMYHLGRGDFARAETLYAEAVARDPALVDARVNGGLCRYARGDAAGAIAHFDAALKIDANFAPAYFNRALLREEMGDFRGAVADANRAVECDGKQPASRFLRAQYARTMGDRRAALADLDAALALEPDYVDALCARGAVRGELGNLDGAHADLARALALDSRAADAYANRARLKSQTGDAAGAIADLTTAIGIDGGVAGYFFNRGLAQQKLKNWPAALADFERAIALDPTAAATFSTRGVIHMEMGNAAAAMADFDRAVELDPRHWQAWANRVAVLEDSDVPAAIESMKQAYRHCSNTAAKAQFAAWLRRHGVPDPEGR